ncbi:MAG: hypothetical protein AAGC77_10315 [Pseudomonadota bacterium]
MVSQVRAPARFTEGDTSAVEADGRSKILALLPRLEERFKNADWWYGTNWSIIDVYLYWRLCTAASAGMSFEGYSAVLVHLKKTQALPEYAEAIRREALYKE